MNKQRHTFWGLVFIAVMGMGLLPFQMHICQLPRQVQAADTCPMQETATSGGCCSRHMDVITCSMAPIVNDTDGQAQTAMTCQCSFVAVASSVDVFLPKVDTNYSLDLLVQSSRVVSDRDLSGDNEYLLTSTRVRISYAPSSPLFLLNSSFLI